MSRMLLVLGAIFAACACAILVGALRVPRASSVHPMLQADHPEAATAAPAAGVVPRAQVAPEPIPPAPVRVRAHDAQPVAQAGATSPAPRPGAAPAMRIEPEHSGPTLTIEELQDLARKEGEGLVTIRNADGSETLNHEGRFADYTVLRVGPDGKPEFVCVQGEAALKRVMQPAATAAPRKED